MLGAFVPATESDPDAVRHPDLGRTPRARVGDSTHRRGGKRACSAVGHRILRMVHNLLSSHRPYEEGGPDYYRPTDTDRLKDRLVQRLKKLGFAVTVAAVETAA